VLFFCVMRVTLFVVVADFAVTDRFGDVSLFVVNGLDRNSKSLAMRIFIICRRCKKTRRREQHHHFHHTVFSLRTVLYQSEFPNPTMWHKIRSLLVVALLFANASAEMLSID